MAEQHRSLQISDRGRRRLTRVIVLSIVVLLLMLSLIAQGGFNLSPFLSPDTAGETLLLYALSTLNFLAFVTLLFVLLRNVLKLVREKQAGRLGSKFKGRLVSYAIGLSLLPVLLLFFFAYGLLNRSIDRWFGDPARQIVEDARNIQDGYFKKEEADLASIVRAVARSIDLEGRTQVGGRSLESQLRREMADHDLSLVRVIARDERFTLHSEDSHIHSSVGASLSNVEHALRNGGGAYTEHTSADAVESVHFVAGIGEGAGDDLKMLIVARQFPSELTARSASIREQHKNFNSLLGKIKRIKATYILLLGAVALLLVFAGTWLALHVARGITVPIQALAEATERVADGDFSQPVQVAAEDELAVLVNSFNGMAGQLSDNRERLERAAEDLKRTNLELDNRRRYIETVLESLSTGVISTDRDARIAMINHAARAMLGLRDEPEPGAPITAIVHGGEREELTSLLRRARRSETAQTEMQFTRPDGSTLHTATTAIALKNSEAVLEGWVVVIEDLTDLIQAERAAAWSEVARRMAHEIKNPLTPIQLSAERILRNYRRKGTPAVDPRFDDLVLEGTSTIVREVSALQRMVEEFSRFARLPEARLVPGSLNELVNEAVGLYTERLNGIRIECLLAEDLPNVSLDPDQLKRVLVNLIDNAIEALDSGKGAGGNGANESNAGQVIKSIRIETRGFRANDSVRLVVEDTGHGIRPTDRDKLFLPKFSTRDRGTGLGLAIVGHIIADHKGRIWVEDNYPRGARFIVELPATRVE